MPSFETFDFDIDPHVQELGSLAFVPGSDEAMQFEVEKTDTDRAEEAAWEAVESGDCPTYDEALRQQLTTIRETSDEAFDQAELDKWLTLGSDVQPLVEELLGDLPSYSE